ncbi:MAG: DUF2752 domain-containing protein [Eubacteriales bacterium]|nr:DUF2752 domain-containing protein [Eubacteriales bacterium]
MKIDFRHYIKEVRRKVTKDACQYFRVMAWVITIVITHFTVLKYFLYSLCPSVLITGYPCPACGMTRAGILLLTGRFAEAAHMQPFIYVLGAFAVGLCIYRYLFLKDSLEWAKWCLIIIIICMIVFYVYRMIRYFPTTAPMTYYEYNLLYRLRVLYGKIVF